jgi:hypothetical protein
MAKPIAVQIHDAQSEYFLYENRPMWIPFKEFEEQALFFSLYHPDSADHFAISAMIMLDNEEAIHCNIFLSKEQTLCFTDMVGSLRHSFEQTPENYSEEVLKALKPVLDNIEFTLH